MALFKFKNKAARKKQAEPDYAALRGVSHTRGDWSLTTSEAIYAAVSRIANGIAMLPLHLYHNGEIAYDDPREKLLGYMPNASMTPYFFKSTMEAFRNTEGNAYALIVPDPVSGQVVSLDVLDAARVQVERAIETKEIWYSFSLDNGQKAMVHSSCMIALHHISANGEKGIRPIDVLRETLTYGEKVREFSLQQLEGVNNGVVLTLPNQSIDKSKKDAMVESFIDTYKKSGGRVMVLEGGATATLMSRSPVDANVLDVERVNKNRVAAVYGIPPHMLGDFSNATYSTAEQAQQEFLNFTLMPIVTQWQDELDLKLLTWEEKRKGFQWRFDISAMKKADTATTAEKYQKAIRGSWMRPNEVRRIEGLPEVEGGDELLASRDLVRLSEILKAVRE